MRGAYSCGIRKGTVTAGLKSLPRQLHRPSVSLRTKCGDVRTGWHHGDRVCIGPPEGRDGTQRGARDQEKSQEGPGCQSASSEETSSYCQRCVDETGFQGEKDGKGR